MASIDLASDLGEGAPDDGALLAMVSTAHISCGRHAGSRELTARTIELARARGVAVGAHPGYDDPANFGRVPQELSHDALVALVRTQLEDFAALAGGPISSVKAHGALYNQAERDADVASAIVEAVVASGASRSLVATPTSPMARAAAAAGLTVLREGFADRAYEPDGTLRSRAKPGALHTDPQMAARQAVALARGGGIDTICVHGDTPGAAAIATAVRAALEEAGYTIGASR